MTTWSPRTPGTRRKQSSPPATSAPAAYAAIASEALTLYDQDEADEGDIVPLTVDRFTKDLTAHNEHVSPNFRRAVSDFALLGTLLHITRYTLGL